MPDHPFRIRTDEKGKTVTFVFDPPVALFPMTVIQGRKLLAKLTEKLDLIDPPTKKKRTRPQPVLPPSLPSWLKEEIWERWVAHRIEIKKPLTHSMMSASLRTMEKLWKLGQDIEAVVDQSIAGGYQGLFAIETPLTANVAQQPASYTAPTPDNKRCIRCSGTNLYYPSGFSGGVAPCREHQWADDEPEPAPAETVVAIESYLRKVAMK